jgi:hypothetical protein
MYILAAPHHYSQRLHVPVHALTNFPTPPRPLLPPASRAQCAFSLANACLTWSAKSPTSCPPGQSFHVPSCTHTACPSTRIVQLLVTPSSLDASTESRRRVRPSSEVAQAEDLGPQAGKGEREGYECQRGSNESFGWVRVAKG